MIKSIILTLAAIGLVGPAVAQSSSWSIEGTVGVVSDYRYRGYSLSDEQPALQAGLTLGHVSGVYGDIYVSSIDEYGVGADGDGSQIEITGSAGWAGSVENLNVDVGVSAYQYPDGDDVNYIEFPVQVGQSIGAVTWTLGTAYAPAQAALGDDDNRYAWGGLTYAPDDWPISVAATVGYEDGAFAPDGKIDWSVGVAKTVGRVTLGLAWVDSSQTDAEAVASAFYSF